MNKLIDLKPFLDYQYLQSMAEKYGSPLYILDVEKLKNNYEKIYSAFSRRYDRFIIGYSYKTNYLPYLCKKISDLGGYAEVVSRLEYDLAIKIGVDPNKIIFNGPVKTKEDVFLALSNKSILNLDSLYEWEYVEEYSHLHRNDDIKIGLRLNFNINSENSSVHQEGYEMSRFGFCTENGGFEQALLEISKLNNVKVAGLHGHFSTKDRRPTTYAVITEKLAQIAKSIPYEVEYIDVGGGIYGELPQGFIEQPPSFDDYATAICDVMNQQFQDNKPLLILEPGISMVANVFSFLTKVVERKKIQDQYFTVVDGSVHNIKPTMHKRNLPMTVIPQNQLREQASYHIVGYTCMEKDYLSHDVIDVLPTKGDWISFENVGAYTIVFNPPFIKERPAIVALDGNKCFLTRKRESFEQFFNHELYIF